MKKLPQRYPKRNIENRCKILRYLLATCPEWISSRVSTTFSSLKHTHTHTHPAVVAWFLNLQKTLSHYLFKFCFWPISSSFSYSISIKHLLKFHSVNSMPLTLFPIFFPNLLVFCASIFMISCKLSPNSFLLSLAMSNLVTNLSTRFSILVIYF